MNNVITFQYEEWCRIYHKLRAGKFINPASSELNNIRPSLQLTHKYVMTIDSSLKIVKFRLTFDTEADKIMFILKYV